MSFKKLVKEPNSWNAEQIGDLTVRSFPQWFDRFPLGRYLFSNEPLPAYDGKVIERLARKLRAYAVFEDNHWDIGDCNASLTNITFYRKAN
ncbi:MAG: hypothetical protein AABX10_03935 [Nanoarchaeota archaeon]